MVLVYFVYGLAFFSMGFAIVLESRQHSRLPLATTLPLLAAFGVLHGMADWADMFLFLGTAPTPGYDLEAVRLARTFLLGISAGALAQFGANLLAKAPAIPGAEAPATGPKPSRLWLRLLPPGLGIAWLGALILIPADYPPGSRQWLIHAEVWARYLLYLPGSLLAGLALISEAGLLDQSYLRRTARDARLAGGALLFNALVSGLVVPSGQHLPLSTFTYDGFEAAFGFPVQLLQAAIALAVAYFILRLLELFRIQSQRRVEQAQKLATLEERERIAREMHDGLAQVIGYLNLKTRLIRQMVGSGQLDQAERGLEEMQTVVQESYADVRQSILSLRTARDLGGSLAEAIKRSAADFQEQNGLPVELELPAEDEPSFPPEAEVQLVRIVQEALANVRKHSRASRVRIRLGHTEDETILSIEDDGIGFDPAGLSARNRLSFGLETMRERAEAVGARLELAAAPGEGTRVEVRFPL